MMKYSKFLFFIGLMIISKLLLADIGVDSIPSGYTNCPNTIQGSGTCSQYTYLGNNTIQMDQSGYNVSENWIRIRFRKCDLGIFGGSGTFYIKEGTNACGTILGQAPVNVGDDVTYVFIDYDHWDVGSIDITGVLVSNAGNTTTRYWAGNMELIKDCADYQVSDVTISDNTVYQGQEDVTVECFISNIGADNGSDDVDFYISSNTTVSTNDHQLGDEIFSLDPYSSTTISRIIDIPILPAGGYYLLAKADSNEGDEECQEFNNANFTYFTINSAPDLIVTNVVLSDSQICLNDNITVSITFKNQGESSAGNFTYHVNSSRINSLGHSSQILESSEIFGGLILSGTSSTRNITIDINDDDQSYILIDIDPNDAVTEQNEYNNFKASFSFIVDILPLINYPKNNEEISDLTQEFHWQSTGYPRTYNVVVQRTSNNSKVHAKSYDINGFYMPTGVLLYN